MTIRTLLSSLSLKNNNAFVLLGLLLFAAGVFWYAFRLGIFFPPVVEAGGVVVTVPKGATADDIAGILYDKQLIRHIGDFLLYVKLTRNDKTLHPGTFVFTKSESVPHIIERIKNVANIREITILEGWDVSHIANYLQEEGLIKKEEFERVAKQYEGYLYPDTYKVFENISAEELTALMRDNFFEKTRVLKEQADNSGYDFNDAVIMASLLEREANGQKDRRIISGILWKRLHKNVLLQVDATLAYLTGKSSSQLGKKELGLDSPYNTYKFLGLPPAPISNPALYSIKAALEPEESPYWYYLHDKKGNPHYARTFEEHKQNKIQYLR